jgi:hypothetical protein
MTSTVRGTARAEAQQVFDVLADGWGYAAWVVGTARVRAVDPEFPKPGARIHHSVGLWPALMSDRSQVLRVVPGREIELDVAIGPLGRGTVTVRLEPLPDGRCDVVLSEVVNGRLAGLVPEQVSDVVLAVRNRETLHRLIALAERAGTPVD